MVSIFAILLISVGCIVAIARLSRMPAGLPRISALPRLRNTLPIKYPQVFDTGFVTARGYTQPASLHVYNDAVYIYDTTGRMMAHIHEPEIQSVVVGDFSREDTTMVGFGIVSPNGQYRFLHVGPCADFEVDQIVWTITATVERGTGRIVPRLNFDDILHRASSV